MTASPLPRLTHARLPLTRELCAVNEYGELQHVWIPVERALTVYVDKRELVTLMTLGAQPELLVLGYLRNQRLISSAHEVESITVDWEVGAAAVKTRSGIANIEEKTASKVVTTGCGQGSVFGSLMADVDKLVLPAATLTQEQLYGIVNAIRVQDSTYKTAGSVHGCALFRRDEMLTFVEDVGRHNAIDTIAGWMWMQDVEMAPRGAQPGRPIGAEPQLVLGARALAPRGGPSALDHAARMSGADKVFYTTGRLTSEMVIKAAQMGIPIVVSRSGITQMGLEVAQRLDLCAIGRATNKRFLCFSGAQRLQLQPELAGAKLRVVA
ncbi:MAG: formate dehydrogenase accessory sulfurtransferase FdhD [Rhodoferax sp.]|nr:formate dehydrogenase accessory sulfurtransferase FdhD [Rhodoferax sp.]